MVIKKIFILKILLIISGIANCYAQKELSLDDCLILAKRNNISIKKSKLLIEDAYHGKKNAFTKYFPTIIATGIGMKASSGLLEANLAGMNLSLINKGIYGGVSLTQPIYAGGQIINANKLAETITESQKIQLGIITDEVELLTEKFYWQYFQTKEKLNTIETIEKLINQTLKEVHLSVKAGLITSNNELQVKLKQDEIITAKIQLQNSCEIIRMLLAQHIGIDVDSLKISNIVYNEIVEPTTYFVNYNTALQDNKTYNYLNTNVEISKFQTKIEKGKLLPTVAIGANYLFENMVDKNHTIGMAYISVSIPISNWWGGSHSIKQKKANEKIAMYNRMDASEKILVQMQGSYKELEVAYLQIHIAKSSVDNASENMRLCTNFYKAGTVTLSDLLDAQSLFQKARDTYVDKYTEYMVKLSNYKKIIGK